MQIWDSCTGFYPIRNLEQQCPLEHARTAGKLLGCGCWHRQLPGAAADGVGVHGAKIGLCHMQVVKVEPYTLPAAHKALLDLSRSLNRQTPDQAAAQAPAAARTATSQEAL